MGSSSSRSPLLKALILTTLLLWNGALSAQVQLVPAHVFPDAKSDVITHIDAKRYSQAPTMKVLDGGLEGDWYWTTYEGELVGYVSKRELVNKRQLRPGTLIRTNPTYNSWVLTKYEKGDRVRVRSRLAVGRVSFTKEIPVYFQLPEPTAEPSVPAPTIAKTPAPTVAPTDMEPPVIPEPQPAEESPAEIEAAERIAEDTAIEEPMEAMIPEETPSVIATVPEMVDPPETKETFVDPLLEEAPRVSPQELANLAPPSTNLQQEFEGYLRVVPANDPLADEFQYQLETRSGKRIVYVAVQNLKRNTDDHYIDQWINIRGSLDEVGEDFTLFIDAFSIWVAPEE